MIICTPLTSCTRALLRLACVAAIAGLLPLHATLIDRGNGLIYDSDQNLTFDQNLTPSLGSILASGDFVSPPGGFRPIPQGTGGQNVRFDAVADWIAYLNYLQYKGQSRWRLPETRMLPGGVVDSELGRLFTALGNGASSSVIPPTVKIGPFVANSRAIYERVWDPISGDWVQGGFLFTVYNLDVPFGEKRYDVAGESNPDQWGKFYWMGGVETFGLWNEMIQPYAVLDGDVGPSAVPEGSVTVVLLAGVLLVLLPAAARAKPIEKWHAPDGARSARLVSLRI